MTPEQNQIVERLLNFIIRYNEGGYVSPERAAAIGDTGGETKYGITKRSYPYLDIKSLTVADAVEIYKRDFVSAIPFLSDVQMMYQVLDMAINAGPGRALSLLKTAVTVKEYQAARLKFYSARKLWSNPQVRKSWENRTNRMFI